MAEQTQERSPAPPESSDATAAGSNWRSVAVIARPPRRRTSPRRFVERLFLGAIMGVIAALLDRRLRRVFSKR